MRDSSRVEPERPEWAKPDAFPAKPDGQADFGYVDSRGYLHGAESADQLAGIIARSPKPVDLVWAPESDRLIVPEEIPTLRKSLRLRQARQAAKDLSDGWRMGLLFGGFLVWSLWAAWNHSDGNIESLYSHQLSGIAALLGFVFGVIPCYRGWKMKHHLTSSSESDLEAEIPEARFDAWLGMQRIHATWWLLGGLLVCGLGQIIVDSGRVHFEVSIVRAGLLKEVALSFPEQVDGRAWWRMLTAPMLHGNVVHFLLNAGGLLYLGRRCEIMARWPHMLIVFIVAAWVGSLASLHWIPNKIHVGASGGLMGLLGFVLVFEQLHPRLVPRSSKKRLLAGLLLMMVIGLLGMSFIDNAAHVGGLLAGMAYALIVFPASGSTTRPESIKRDVVAGFCAAGVIVFALCAACVKMSS